MENYKIDSTQRININYLLDGGPYEYALKANSIISQHGGEVTFIPKGTAIPHITLLMGVLLNATSLDLIVGIIKATAATFEPVRYEISNPYYIDNQNKYLFVDTNPQNSFLLQRTKLQENLDDLLEMDKYGDASIVSHITLGYFAKGGPSSLLDFLNVPATLRAGIASRLQIAFTGSHGTCTHTLWQHTIS